MANVVEVAEVEATGERGALVSSRNAGSIVGLTSQINKQAIGSERAGAFHGTVVIGMALFGTVIGAMFGGIPTNRLGRKKTLLLIGVLYTLSAIGSAFANDPVTFGIYRVSKQLTQR